MLICHKETIHSLTQCLKYFTSISKQQRHEERLFLGENVDELLEISDTSASKKIKQLIVSVTWMINVDNVFSLLPRDTPDSSKLSDKRNISDDAIQQLCTPLIVIVRIIAASKGRTSPYSAVISAV